MRKGLSAVVAVLLVARGLAAEQQVPAHTLRAAFLYNFAKFAEWPADSVAAGRLTLCVLGDDSVADALVETTRDRTIDGRAIIVSRVKADGALRGCHLLYVTGLDLKHTAQLLAYLKDASVFTVSDQEQFAKAGGIAELFVESGKMRFAVNVDAAQRAHLHISSRLLSLAKLVKDERSVQR